MVAIQPRKAHNADMDPDEDTDGADAAADAEN